MLGSELPKSFADLLTQVGPLAHELVRRWAAITSARDSWIARAAEALKRLEAGPAVPGYEPFLTRRGTPAFEARLTARAIHHYGGVLVQEDRAARSLARALRAVVAGKSNLVVARRAKALCGQLADGYAELALREACHEAGQPELASELLDRSYKAAGRDSAACQMLPCCAAQLLPYLADPRGRPLSVATAMHEFLLNVMHDEGTPRAFSWSYVNERFVDPVTEATQIAVGNRTFDPRPAVRRFQRRLEGGGRALGARR